MRRSQRFASMLALGVLAGYSAPAAGERLVVSLSDHRVMVASNFTGEELVLFGGIEPDASSRSHRGGYDIAVTVTGPRQTMVTFRKERRMGIWVNADSRAFEEAPSYLAVLSNRPLDAIASNETLRRLQLGLSNIPLPQRASVNIADCRQRRPVPDGFHQAPERSWTLPGGRERGNVPCAHAVSRVDPIASRSPGRHLRGRRAAAHGRHADCTRPGPVRGLQVRL